MILSPSALLLSLVIKQYHTHTGINYTIDEAGGDGCNPSKAIAYVVVLFVLVFQSSIIMYVSN